MDLEFTDYVLIHWNLGKFLKVPKYWFAFNLLPKSCICLQYFSHANDFGLVLQNAGFWPAICRILAYNMHGFAMQNACFWIVIWCMLQSECNLVRNQDENIDNTMCFSFRNNRRGKGFCFFTLLLFLLLIFFYIFAL